MASLKRLPTIHLFWHGSPLSRVERLSLASFVAHGHPVELHVYDEPGGVPPGVRVLDAGAVLDRKEIFLHRRTGSIGPFTDWFRYRLLHARGGIWADTDVVCLKPLDYPQPEIFAWQDEQYLNNAVLGLPAGHALAAWLAEACSDPNRIHAYDGWSLRLRKLRRRFLQGNRRGAVRWGEYGPKGLTHAARHFHMLGQALPPEHFYPVACDDWQRVFDGGSTAGGAAPFTLPAESRAVHLWHAMMHARAGFDKNGSFPADSLFETLCRRYGQ